MRRIYTLILCMLSLSMKVFAQAPVADFAAASTQGCAPFLANFVDNSANNPTSWDWDFGDAGSPGHSFVQNASHMYLAPGNYTITLIVSNASGSDTIVKVAYITVHSIPAASYTMSSDSACSGTQIIFTDSSIPGDTTITNFEWSFNDGSGPVFTNPASHTFLNSTSDPLYFVPTYTITDVFGCSSAINQDTVFVFPNPSPDPDLGPDTTLCLNQVYYLSPGQYDYYLWNDNSIGQGITVPTQQPDTLMFLVIVGNIYGCWSMDSVHVIVDLCSSVDETNNLVNIYPNPFNDFIKINSNEQLNGSYYSILDVAGKVIRNGIIDNGVIDATGLSTGLYYLKIDGRTFVVNKSDN